MVCALPEAERSRIDCLDSDLSLSGAWMLNGVPLFQVDPEFWDPSIERYLSYGSSLSLVSVEDIKEIAQAILNVGNKDAR
jgi:hypothetical protein